MATKSQKLDDNEKPEAKILKTRNHTDTQDYILKHDQKIKSQQTSIYAIPMHTLSFT